MLVRATRDVSLISLVDAVLGNSLCLAVTLLPPQPHASLPHRPPLASAAPCIVSHAPCIVQALQRTVVVFALPA